jgi:hypothetical protein
LRHRRKPETGQDDENRWSCFFKLNQWIHGFFFLFFFPAALT